MQSCKLPILAGLAVIPIVIGCTSIVSHHVTTDESGCVYDTKQLRGVPVTVKVPYQLEVKIVDAYYWLSVAAEKKNELVYKADGTPLCTRTIYVRVIDKEKVVTVDQVRPAAGTLTPLGADKEGVKGNVISDQFFTRIGGKITDNTIQEIDEGINRVFNAATKLNVGMAASAKAITSQDNLTTLETVAAFQVFDVHAHDLEEQVRCFLDLHRCSGHDCVQVHCQKTK